MIAQVQLSDKELEFLAEKIQQYLAEQSSNGGEEVSTEDAESQESSEDTDATGVDQKTNHEESHQQPDSMDDYDPHNGTIMMLAKKLTSSVQRRFFSKEFPTKDSLDDYLQQHPNADKKKHWVKQEGQGEPATEEESPKSRGKAPEEKTEKKVPKKEEPTKKPTVREDDSTEKKTRKEEKRDTSTSQSIDMMVKDKFGPNAKHWKTHSLHESQVRSKTMVVMPDGHKALFGELGDEDQKKVMDAIQNGQAAHHGFSNYGDAKTDYSDVGLKMFQENIKTSLAGVVNKKVAERKNTSKDGISKDNVHDFSSEMRRNGRSVIERYARATSDISRPMLEKHLDMTVSAIGEGIHDGSIKGVSQSEMDDFVREDLKRILHQELETRRRAIGDHGIRHVCSNSANTITMLEELEKGGQPVTGQQKLMALSIQANHDLGYTIGKVALEGSVKGNDKKHSHKVVSERIMKEERPRYEKMFGGLGTDHLLNTVRNHSDVDTVDWKHDPVGSAVKFADCVSLFGKDKVQDLFIRSPQAMKLVGKLYMAAQQTPIKPFEPQREKFDTEEAFNKASKIHKQEKAEYEKPETKKKVEEGYALQKTIKKHLHEVVENGKFHPSDKELLHASIHEMSEGRFSSSQDILSRFSGTIHGFKYDHENEVMHAHSTYTPEGQVIGTVFGDETAAKQFSKTAKDMKAQAVKGERGKIVMTSTVTGKPAIEFDIDGTDDQPLDRATNSAMREFLTKTARGSLMAATRNISPPPESKKQDVANARKAMEESRNLFSDSEWQELQTTFDDNKDSIDVLTKKLKSYPLTEAEKRFLTTVTASSHYVDASIVDSSFSRMIVAENSTGRGKGKDHDLMKDTGGVQKHRTNPSDKPGRDEKKERYDHDKVHKENREDLVDDLRSDIGDDPDMKLSSVPKLWQVTVPFAGVLKIDRRLGKKWGMLELDDALRTSIFRAMDLDDVWEDPDNSAHISVFSDEEVEKLPKQIPEEGEIYTFTVVGIASVEPEDWRGIDEVVMAIVESPELSRLRAKYGFTPLLFDSHRFHITLAVRKEE